MRQTRKRFGNFFTVTKVWEYRSTELAIASASAKRQLKNGYMANWTEELFTIVDAHRLEPPVYRLADWHGERLEGTFYEPELQKVVVSKDKTYRIEEILRWRNKRREAFVKWFGWPASFNSWIDAKTLVNYSK